MERKHGGIPAGCDLGRSRDAGDCGGAAAPFASPAARADLEADSLEVRRPGVDAYPTPLLRTAHGTDRQGGGLVASAAALTHALGQHVAATAAT